MCVLLVLQLVHPAMQAPEPESKTADSADEDSNEHFDSHELFSKVVRVRHVQQEWDKPNSAWRTRDMLFGQPAKYYFVLTYVCLCS